MIFLIYNAWIITDNLILHGCSLSMKPLDIDGHKSSRLDACGVELHAQGTLAFRNYFSCFRHVYFKLHNLSPICSHAWCKPFPCSPPCWIPFAPLRKPLFSCMPKNSALLQYRIYVFSVPWLVDVVFGSPPLSFFSFRCSAWCYMACLGFIASLANSSLQNARVVRVDLHDVVLPHVEEPHIKRLPLCRRGDG